MLEYVGRFDTMNGKLPSGDAGTVATLELMQAVAEGPRGARNRLVREAAVRVLQGAGSPQHDPGAQMGALFRWVRDRVMFVGDVAGTQTVQSPLYTLHVMAGNCVQRAVLLAALALSLGIPAKLRFRAIAANPASPLFSHVYVVADIGGRSVAFDPTYRSNGPGYEYPSPRRRMDIAL